MAVLSTKVVPVWLGGCSPQKDPVQCNNYSVSLSLPFGTRIQCLGWDPENCNLNEGYKRQAITSYCTPVMFGTVSILLHVTNQWHSAPKGEGTIMINIPFHIHTISSDCSNPLLPKATLNRGFNLIFFYLTMLNTDYKISCHRWTHNFKSNNEYNKI